jgi:Family of unknown function (DUF6011)
MKITGTVCMNPGCGRKLTASRSVARMVGPRCAKKMDARMAAALTEFKPETVRKALAAIADGRFTREPGSVSCWSSQDTGPKYQGITRWTCPCPAGEHGRKCYHRAGFVLLNG